MTVAVGRKWRKETREYAGFPVFQINVFLQHRRSSSLSSKSISINDRVDDFDNNDSTVCKDNNENNDDNSYHIIIIATTTMTTI